MGFWSLFEVASMPILQVLLISVLGAFIATGYCNLLTSDARKSLNKMVFMVFTPSLMFASLAKTVTLEDIISWWFMPVNVGLTFFVGGFLGWVLVKLLKPKPHLEGLIMATCSAGNLGNLMLIIIPAICHEPSNPFGNRDICSTVGLSYASFSMALGGFFIWTYTFQLVRSSSIKYKALQAAEEVLKVPNVDWNANGEAPLLKGGDEEHVVISADSIKCIEEDIEDQGAIVPASESKSETDHGSFWGRIIGVLHQILEELMSPPTIAAFLGFAFGAVTWLRNLIIGDGAPLRVIQDSIKLLGDGTIPCITLILGGNLTQGMRTSQIRPRETIGVICVRYIISPLIGIGIVKVAGNLGFLPPDPLYHFVLMVQFTLPPAMNIGTMAQLFDVAQEECSVLFLWTYLVAAFALTFWSTVFMWILT